MKASNTHQGSATTRPMRYHNMRSFAIACSLLGAALFAQSASADCPPGYVAQHRDHGRRPDMCVPAPAPTQQPYMRSVGPHMGTIVPIGTKHKAPFIERRIVDPHKVKPVPSAPIEHRSGASESHAIIFVGGHSQPAIAHDKAALNPQPIPPGHAIKRLQHSGTPIETSGH